jgi:S-formylglutathione hydrolase FrmB
MMRDGMGRRDFLRFAGVAGAAAGVGTAGLRPRLARAAEPPVPADTGATIIAENWLDLRTADLTVNSPALAQTVTVRLIVPPRWTRGADRTWPVLYALHGGADNYTSWTRETDIEQLSSQWDVMVVTPECGSDGSFTDWWNGGLGGPPKWETFHVSEVRQLIERNYGAGRRRAVMGLSSGGEGAMMYSGRYPGMFRYAASYSGLLYQTMSGIPALLLNLFKDENINPPTRVWGDPVLDAANWRAHDPYWLVPRLRGTGLYVSSGNGQPGPLDDLSQLDPQTLSAAEYAEALVGKATESFVTRLQMLGVPGTIRLYGNGLHRWPYWLREMHISWPLMMNAIGARQF